MYYLDQYDRECDFRKSLPYTTLDELIAAYENRDKNPRYLYAMWYKRNDTMYMLRVNAVTAKTFTWYFRG